MQKLAKLVFGSKLYGTNTPMSDTDYKTIVLPNVTDLLLGKRLEITKDRFDVDGNRIGPNVPMTDAGIEEEFVPLQMFVRDFYEGQTYAVEVAFGILQRRNDPEVTPWMYQLVEELVERFKNREVYPMVGFATKQVFDYVRRGQRLNESLKLLGELNKVAETFADVKTKKAYLRLDDVVEVDGVNQRLLDYVSVVADLPLDIVENNGISTDALLMGGRKYMATTELRELIRLIQKKVDEYGSRTNTAAMEAVDPKSLSHAVRVYQQVIEYLATGSVSFPRKNVEQLLTIKSGKSDAEEVKALLEQLDDETRELLTTSSLPEQNDKLRADLEQWLASKLLEAYGLFAQELPY